jgi:hypothetical protein
MRSERWLEQTHWSLQIDAGAKTLHVHGSVNLDF